MTNYCILIPPSEGKAIWGAHPDDDFTKKLLFAEQSRKVSAALVNTVEKYGVKELEKIFHVKGKHLAKTIETNKNIPNNPLLRAIDRYTGVMYEGIDYASMDTNQMQRFDASVLIVTGLMGIVRPPDLIPDYKLPMGSKIKGVDTNKYWRTKIQTHYTTIVGDNLILNLLPQVHKKVIPATENEIHISFMRSANGTSKLTGHHGKKLKGEFIRFIIGFEELSRSDLEKFSHPDGYTYSPTHSSEKEIVYEKTT